VEVENLLTLLCARIELLFLFLVWCHPGSPQATNQGTGAQEATLGSKKEERPDESRQTELDETDQRADLFAIHPAK